MDIEKAKEIVQGLKVYYDNYSLLDEEEKEENELVNNSIDLILAELDKDNNIISDLQNEVTLKQCELDKKDKIIKEMAKELTTPVHGVDWVIDYFTKKAEGK